MLSMVSVYHIVTEAMDLASDHITVAVMFLPLQ
jgi:hypothetical protein